MPESLSSEASSLIDHFEAYLKANNYDTTTMRNRVRSVSNFIRRWEEAAKKPLRGPGLVVPKHIEILHNSAAEQGTSQATLSDELTALRLFFRSYVEQGKLEKNPAEGLKAPGTTKKAKKKADRVSAFEEKVLVSLTDEDNDYLLRIAKGRSRPEVIRQIIDEHRNYKSVMTAQRLQEKNRKDLEELFERLKSQLLGQVIEQLAVTEDEIRAMHAFNAALVLEAIAQAARGETDIVKLFDAGLARMQSDGKAIIANIAVSGADVQKLDISSPGAKSA